MHKHETDSGNYTLALEEGVATHPSILAWRIPWTKEPGGLPSTGRKEHNRVSPTVCHVSM